MFMFLVLPFLLLNLFINQLNTFFTELVPNKNSCNMGIRDNAERIRS